MHKVKKGYLAELFNQHIAVRKDVTYVRDCHYRGLNINAGRVAEHGGAMQCGRPWLDQLLRILQYGYLRSGSHWLAMHVKIHVIPYEMQSYEDPVLALSGKELLDLVLEEVEEQNSRFVCNYRIFLEKDEPNPYVDDLPVPDKDGCLVEREEGGFHHHACLVATGINSEASLEIAFRKVIKKHPKFKHACMEFIAPDVKRVSDSELKAYFVSNGVAPQGKEYFLPLNSDVAYEYAFYWLSYVCKRHTKELLGKEGRGWRISRGNRMKDPLKGIHVKNKTQAANESQMRKAA